MLLANLHDKKLSLAMCLMSLIAYGAILSTGLDEPFAQDWDEGVYLSSARNALEGHPFYTSIFNAQAPAFLQILTFAFRIFEDSVVIGRALIVFFSLVYMSAVGWIAWRVAFPYAAPIAILLQGLSIVFYRQSTIVEAEIVSLSFALLAVALLSGTQQAQRSGTLLVAGFLFAFGALCKLLVA